MTPLPLPVTWYPTELIQFNMPTILRASELTFGHPDQPLFTNWSATIPAGVTLVKCDESRGKTTLLRLLASDLPVQTGTLSIRDISLNSQPEQYRSEVFFIEPRSESFDQISPMHFFAKMAKIYPRFDASRLPALMTGLCLTPHQDKPLYMLSAGSKRKVWIAAGLVCGAAVTLIDDLFAALDLGSIEFLLDQLGACALDTDRAYIVAHYDVLARVPCACIIEL